MRRVTIPAAVAVALVTGCGGGSGGRLSKSEYVSKADAICAKYNKKITALGSPKTISDIAGFADKAIPIAQKGDDELRALKPPKNEDTTAKAWVAQNDAVLTAIEKLRDAAKKNNRAAIQTALQDGNKANAAANKYAHQLGLKVCAKG